ncbi:MAG: alanine--tRNA ligase [Ruminococcaceae bacterium]|nr:alanine--tRNA ligase [Oscillospiraceae bacterium]
MQYTGLNELREKYLSFFESKGHLRMKSFSLVPENDKSLLLINAGMAPLKPYFIGSAEPPRRRVTTCQKCIRTPDIDRVGKTARHGTFFEMLGNFSFGDYFKREAIHWSLEFLTDILEIPKDLLWPSIYEEDDEAFEIWNKECGIPAERIVRLGKDDNFWELGSGPCGPCSEIYFDRGEAYGCGSPDCKPGCDCDRFMEIWNNVFTQFNNDGNGNYTELAQKNIDTGMGLERLACVMQGVDNLFEVDTVRRILDRVCAISDKTYGAKYEDDVAIRVITDHIRSSVFLISDGVIPSNEGRGYVLRRIIRRAARYGKLIGIDKPFLFELCDLVIDESKGGYPELWEKRDYIKKILSNEEDRFRKTLDSGLNILESLIDANPEKLSGADVFKLYDTYGFPLDLTRELCSEKGIDIDEEGFTALMKEQRERARAARADGIGWEGSDSSLTDGISATEFTGYEENVSEAKVAAIIYENESVESLSEGEAVIILDRTPFYAESGGQIGDTGIIEGEKALLTVSDTKKTKTGVYLHTAVIENGILSVGDTVTAKIDEKKRADIRRNHSAVHLLQAALRKILGDHCEQAGSYVSDKFFRFDFKHFQAMTADEVKQAEALVNEFILSAYEVNTIVTDPESAKAMGALALFGEKYGKSVRMVKMGDVSTELCGGTHIDNTSKAGLFKITSESGIAAGIRRIEGITGRNVLEYIEKSDALEEKTAAVLKANNKSDIEKKAAALQSELHDMKLLNDSLTEKLASAQVSTLGEKVRKNDKASYIFAELQGFKTDSLRTACDKLKDKYSDIVCVLYSIADGKITFAAGCGKDAVKAGFHAGNILKKISPIVGGGGGGRPDNATSGGKKPELIGEAEKEFYAIVNA